MHAAATDATLISARDAPTGPAPIMSWGRRGLTDTKESRDGNS
jgi:hypothetical protein